MRTVPSFVGRRISWVPDGRARRSVPRRSHQNPLSLPRAPLVTKTVMGMPLASAIGIAFVRLSTYPSSKVTTTRGRRDGTDSSERVDGSPYRAISSRCAAKFVGVTQSWKGSSTLPRPGDSRESASRYDSCCTSIRLGPPDIPPDAHVVWRGSRRPGGRSVTPRPSGCGRILETMECSGGTLPT